MESLNDHCPTNHDAPRSIARGRWLRPKQQQQQKKVLKKIINKKPKSAKIIDRTFFFAGEGRGALSIFEKFKARPSHDYSYGWQPLLCVRPFREAREKVRERRRERERRKRDRPEFLTLSVRKKKKEIKKRTEWLKEKRKDVDLFLNVCSLFFFRLYV